MAMGTPAVTPFRSFVQTPIFSVFPLSFRADIVTNIIIGRLILNKNRPSLSELIPSSGRGHPGVVLKT